MIAALAPAAGRRARPGLEAFSIHGRPAFLEALAMGPLDLLVIGGGITGASIFRDAALRGLRVGLVEAGDFASGTSGRSSKLIHGGLRYLRELGLRLARESCRERDLQVRLNKRLVWPMPFLLPLYRGRAPGRLELRVGMLAYEALSGFANPRLHRFIDRAQALIRAPGLPAEGLDGACLYYDAAVSDHRFVIETVKDGVRAGGLAINHTRAEGLIRERDRVAGVLARDRLGGGCHEIRAEMVINATGTGVDRLRRMAEPLAEPLVRRARGTHLVFAAEDVPLNVTVAFPSPVDRRPLFLLKREGCFLYGTTDRWVDNDAGPPRPGAEDVAYLLESLDRFLPDAGLGRAQVRYAYAGDRPLVAPQGRRAASEKASREDLIERGPGGLVTVVGGKLTTARAMAERVVDEAVERLGLGWRSSACRTHRLPLGGSNQAVAEGLARAVKRCPRLGPYFRVLFQRYGPDAEAVCESARRIALAEGVEPGIDPIRAEVEYVCRREMVCSVEDLIERRAGFLEWDRDRRLGMARYGARAIGEELGLGQGELEAQMARYRARLERDHGLP